MTALEFDIRKLSFYENGNPFAGSCDRFRFRISPQEGALGAAVWDGDVCYENAIDKTEERFPLTQEGFDALRSFLQAQYDARAGGKSSGIGESPRL